ncbi:flagellar hook-length control protein FliK [Undibacterium baiyunense]|uniref:Flagellar hook-length control protein FliK n=1 Tax=Undibacterium baiyunense TaxID=2828731 RepID=A0A941DHA1_9BURK|nr:flagellar hook-length control protein FliK [Undibacterium baiyunense]MBR7748060.1 flagellar hook-length control protein FliK [Undibacterium baiyunense]
MPNAPTLNPVLPGIVANKASNAPTESKNTNTFNQVLKNEVANKSKKTSAEVSAKNNNEHKTVVTQNNKSMTSEEQKELNEVEPSKPPQDDEQTTVAINDPTTLLMFVNNISALSQADTTDSVIDVSIETQKIATTDSLVNDDLISTDIDASDTPDLSTINKNNGENDRVMFSTPLNNLTDEKQIIEPNIKAKEILESHDDLILSPQPQLNNTKSSTPIANDVAEPPVESDLLQQQAQVLVANTNPQQVTNKNESQASQVELNIATTKIDNKDSQTTEKTWNTATVVSDSFAHELEAQASNKLDEQNLEKFGKLEVKVHVNETQVKQEVINTTHVTTIKPEKLATPIISDYIAPRVGTKGWDQAVGQKIVWMVAGGEQSAQLTLNPPDLGPVQVVLSISDNFVDASFVSSHLDVREAIESAAPKLREMMENAGISLSGFSVSAESAQSNNQFSAEKSFRNTSSQTTLSSGTDIESDQVLNTLSNRNTGRDLGLVDTFV